MSSLNTSASHVPRSNQYDRTVINNAQLNALVDQVFTRVLDKAKTRLVHYNALTDKYDLETLDVARVANARTQNTVNLERFLPDEPSVDIKFTVFNHTCPICLASFEHAQFLLRHFTTDHVLGKPVYKCTICSDEISYMPLDEFFRHCFIDEKHLNWFLGKMENYCRWVFLCDIWAK